MSNLSFECPACQAVCEAPLSIAGKQINCPNCQVLIEIPVPEDAPLTLKPIESSPSQRNSNADTMQVIGSPIEDDNSRPHRGRIDVPDNGGRRGRREEGKRDEGRRDEGRRRRRPRRENYSPRNSSGNDDTPNIAEFLLCIFCACFGCILGFIYLAQGKSSKGITMIITAVCASVFWSVIRVLLEAAAR